MASIWSKTKLRRAEREEGFGSVEEVEKGFTRERRGVECLGEQRERRLRRSSEYGVCAI